MRGLSPRNLKYMRAFASAWPDREIVQRVVAQLPWRQNIALLERLDDEKPRLWYAERTLRHEIASHDATPGSKSPHCTIPVAGPFEAFRSQPGSRRSAARRFTRFLLRLTAGTAALIMNGSTYL